MTGKIPLCRRSSIAPAALGGENSNPHRESRKLMFPQHRRRSRGRITSVLGRMGPAVWHLGGVASRARVHIRVFPLSSPPSPFGLLPVSSRSVVGCSEVLAEARTPVLVVPGRTLEGSGVRPGWAGLHGSSLSAAGWPPPAAGELLGSAPQELFPEAWCGLKYTVLGVCSRASQGETGTEHGHN